jgi:hypothetical protein
MSTCNGQPGFIDVRDAGKLLLRFDPDRDIIEVQRRGVRTTIDLQRLREDHKNETIRSVHNDQCANDNPLTGKVAPV